MDIHILCPRFCSNKRARFSFLIQLDTILVMAVPQDPPKKFFNLVLADALAEADYLFQQPTNVIGPDLQQHCMIIALSEPSRVSMPWGLVGDKVSPRPVLKPYKTRLGYLKKPKFLSIFSISRQLRLPFSSSVKS